MTVESSTYAVITGASSGIGKAPYYEGDLATENRPSQITDRKTNPEHMA